MKTFLVGMTQPNLDQILKYLEFTDQKDFYYDWNAAKKIPGPLRMASMFAKLCYKSLVLGKNPNVTKIRSIEDNIKSVVDSGHGSVFEHIVFNFITTNCSRVFTHELVRHRAGTAFSQTSGRYCALDENSSFVIHDPVLPEAAQTELQSMFERLRSDVMILQNSLITDAMPFAEKKKITSALRRIAPNGQSNEIAWSANLRALRHMIEMRTSPHAEWEIREVFMDIADNMIHKKYLYGGTRNEDGSWTGLKI